MVHRSDASTHRSESSTPHTHHKAERPKEDEDGDVGLDVGDLQEGGGGRRGLQGQRGRSEAVIKHPVRNFRHCRNTQTNSHLCVDNTPPALLPVPELSSLSTDATIPSHHSTPVRG